MAGSLDLDSWRTTIRRVVGAGRLRLPLHATPWQATAPGVFISYAREDRVFAQWLAHALEDRRIVIAADWKIPTGSDYQRWLTRSLDESTACLFIISEWSVRSEPCLGELRHAVREGLRLLPVVRQSPPDDWLPPELRLPNWLFLREEDDVSTQLDTLVRDAQIDLEADLEERDWRQRAGEWERAGRPKWFLVSPGLAHRAAEYLAARVNARGADHEAHAAYFAAVRRAYRWLKLSAVALTIAVATLLTVSGLRAWQQSQGQIAQRALSEALGLLQRDPAQTLVPAVLATESLSRQPSLAASELLSTMLPEISHPRRVDAVTANEEHFVALDTDGHVALAVSVSGELTIWNLATQSTRSLHVAGGPLLWVSLSPDGMQVIMSGTDRHLRVVDAESGAVRRTLSLSDKASAVAVTLDLSRAVTAGPAGLVEIWDLTNGTRLDTIRHATAIDAVAIDSSGHWIAAASEDGIVSLWHEGDRRPRVLRHGRTVYDLRFVEAQRTLLTATADGDVQFWSLYDERAPEKRLTHDEASIISELALSADGATLASLSFASSIRVWDTARGTPLATMHQGPTLLKMALSADGTRVLSVGHDEQAHLWSARTGKELTAWSLGGHPRHVALSRFADVAVIGTNSGAEVWRLTSASRMAVWQSNDAVTRLRLNRTGTTLAAVSGRNLLLWDLESRQQLASLAHPAGISDIAVDDSSTRMSLADESGTGAVYDVRDGTRLCTFRSRDVQGGTGISPDGRIAAVGSWDGDVVMCDVNSGRELARFTGGSPVRAIALPGNEAEVIVGRGNGDIDQCRPVQGCRRIVEQKAAIRRLAAESLPPLIASTGPDAVLRLWNRDTRRLVATWTQLDFNTDVALTHAGDLVAASSDRGAQLWRTQTGEEVWRAERLGPVAALALSPTGDRIAIAFGNEVRVQATNPDDLIAESCRQLTRNLTENEWHKFLPGVRYSRTCRGLP